MIASEECPRIYDAADDACSSCPSAAQCARRTAVAAPLQTKIEKALAEAKP